MKLIFSRKGFDSSAGGCASPIFPDGGLLSLPIPDRGAAVRYRQLRYPGVAVGPLVHALSRGKIGGADRVHLDPDLCAARREGRRAGWRPALGQHGAALGHLDACGVGPGDVFVFFGWHRAVERAGRGWRFVPGAPDLHVLHGWLRIGAVRRPGERPPAAIDGHRHLDADFGLRNAIYIASDHWRGSDGRRRPGGGEWSRFAPGQVLSASAADCEAAGLSARRGLWRLPAWAAPRTGCDPLSYHSRPDRWHVIDEGVLLATVGRGQEFVLDVAQERAPRAWLEALIDGR